MDQNRLTLTPVEWHVMEYLWDHAPCIGREAVAYLSQHKGWSRSTTLTMLRRMSEKGLISCQEKNGIHVYAPLLRQDEATIQETKSFLDRVYHGSVSMMLSAFSQKQPLSQQEIAELYAILDEAKERSSHD